MERESGKAVVAFLHEGIPIPLGFPDSLEAAKVVAIGLPATPVFPSQRNALPFSEGHEAMAEGDYEGQFVVSWPTVNNMQKERGS